MLEEQQADFSRIDDIYTYVIDTEEIKSVGTRKIHGMGIRFSNENDFDSYREFFDSETVTGLRSGDSRPFIMEHGYGKFGVEILAWAIYEKTDLGWEYDAVFEDTENGNKAYNEIISKPYQSSSGAAFNTVRREQKGNAWRLSSWFIGEQTATQTPADKNNQRITRIKSLQADGLITRLNELEEMVKNLPLLNEEFDKMKKFYYSFIREGKEKDVKEQISLLTKPTRKFETIKP